jgi:hypothetical protein
MRHRRALRAVDYSKRVEQRGMERSIALQAIEKQLICRFLQ